MIEFNPVLGWGSIGGVIYCVVPEPLADELFPRLEQLLRERSERHGDRGPAQVRAARAGSTGGGQREVRDRRRPRVAGEFPPISRACTATAARLASRAGRRPRGRRRPRQPRSRRRRRGRVRARRAGARRGRRAHRRTRRTTSPSTAGCCSGSSAPRRSAPTEVEVVNDSELIADQVDGAYKVKQRRPQARCTRRRKAALAGFARWSIRSVPRAENAAADALVNRALDGEDVASAPPRRRRGGRHRLRDLPADRRPARARSARSRPARTTSSCSSSSTRPTSSGSS